MFLSRSWECLHKVLAFLHLPRKHWGTALSHSTLWWIPGPLVGQSRSGKLPRALATHRAYKTLTFPLGVTKREDLPWLEISQMAFHFSVKSWNAWSISFSCHVISLTICSYCIDSKSLGQENPDNEGYLITGDVGQALTKGSHESSLQVLDPDYLTCKMRRFGQVLSGHILLLTSRILKSSKFTHE